MPDVQATDSRPAERGLADIARRLPSLRGGKPTHPATLTRWILKGITLSDGSTLKLAARKYPGGWAVTEVALRDFTDALTADRIGGSAPTLPRTPAARRRAIDQADRALEAMGV